MISRLARRMHHDFRDNLTTRQRSALVAYASFAATVVAVRALTTAIRNQRGPIRNITVGSVHIHHYLPGIALLTAAGAIAVHGSEKTSVHCLIGVTYGSGCGLITDELPLLLNLRNVYWTPEGRWAVDLALAITASAGAYFTGIPYGAGSARSCPHDRAAGRRLTRGAANLSTLYATVLSTSAVAGILSTSSFNAPSTAAAASDSSLADTIFFSTAGD